MLFNQMGAPAMTWTDLIKAEMENSYRSAEKLMDMVDDSELDWKPSEGSNWMTMGQLLRHIPDACGFCFKGFVTGQWDIPENASGDDMLPPAESFPTVSSVAEAKKLLAADKELALKMLAEAGEDDLENRLVPAPWNPTPLALGHQCLGMVEHLESHKNQLYYYLKLQGKPVNTFHMYGMA
jgi:hypothetical protein